MSTTVVCASLGANHLEMPTIPLKYAVTNSIINADKTILANGFNDFESHRAVALRCASRSSFLLVLI